MATSSSSGEALRANSRAKTSSTPERAVSYICNFEGHEDEGHTWISVDDDAVLGRHVGCGMRGSGGAAEQEKAGSKTAANADGISVKCPPNSLPNSLQVVRAKRWNQRL